MHLIMSSDSPGISTICWAKYLSGYFLQNKKNDKENPGRETERLRQVRTEKS
jgi:hypothetical protein